MVQPNCIYNISYSMYEVSMEILYITINRDHLFFTLYLKFSAPDPSETLGQFLFLLLPRFAFKLSVFLEMSSYYEYQSIISACTDVESNFPGNQGRHASSPFFLCFYTNIIPLSVLPLFNLGMLYAS